MSFLSFPPLNKSKKDLLLTLIHSVSIKGINIIVYDIGKAEVVESRHFSNPNTRAFMRFVRSVMPGRLIIGTSQVLCTDKSAVDFYRQKSVLYALRRLHVYTHGMKPLVFR